MNKFNRFAARLSRQIFGPSRPFVALWTAATASNFADGFFKLALPLYAVTLTDAPSQVAGVTTALTLPWLLFSIPAGSLVDRYDRPVLMIGAHLSRTLVLVAFVLLMLNAQASLPLLYLVAFALGVAEVIADTAADALLPAVVKSGQLEEANARLVGSVTVANEFIGPALGGVLFALSIAAPFSTSGVLYLAAAGALVYLRGSYRAARAAERVRLTEVFEGMTFLWKHPLLRTLAVFTLVMNLCWSAWGALLPLYALAPGPVDLNSAQYGLILTCLGIGGLLGTLVVVPAQRVLGQRWTIGLGMLGTFVLLAGPTLFVTPWPIGAGMLLAGAGSAMWIITVGAIRQRAVPNALLGRVTAAMRLFSYGALPVGAALSGAFAELVGIRVVLGAGALLTCTLFVPFFSTVTTQALSEAQAPERTGEYVT